MELEALKEIDSEVQGLGARIVVLTPELERYTRALHKKLSLPFDILTDLHLKTAQQFGLVFTFPDYLRELYKSFGSTLDRFHEAPFLSGRGTDKTGLRYVGVLTDGTDWICYDLVDGKLRQVSDLTLDNTPSRDSNSVVA
jgi:hypothetical protein